MFIQDYLYKIGLPLLEKKNDSWNFRCVICGDSKKSVYKKRGWIYQKNGIWFYYCHNCGISYRFDTFLKTYYHHIYLEYQKDNFTGFNKKPKKTIKDIKIKNIIFPIKNLIKICDLPKDHVCMKYIRKREIPFKYYNILYFCENYQKEINKLFEDKFEKYPESDKRLVIPYFNKKNQIPFIQGRTITKNYLRYITINLLPTHSKIYGIDRIDVSKKIKIVEGPLDSLFINNCIAMGSSSINFNDLLSISDKNNFVFIYDLEPRNREIIKKIEKIIDNGFSICLFPHEFRKYGKDINEFILSGIDQKQIENIIKENTFNNLIAKIKLKFWRKI